jgi:hypothetical protein
LSKLATNKNVLQIVPRRADQPDGIGDYSTVLAQAMFDHAGIASVFVSGTPAEIESPRDDRWQTDPVPHRTAPELAKQLFDLCRDRAIETVILHVSGYGYQKRGVPFWLLNGIRMWRQRYPNCRLFGIFHELFATGPVWNSSFWLSRAQKNITRAIWDLCDGGMTTTATYFDELTAWRPNTGNLLRKMPVVSNVGEPSSVVPTEERPFHMAVFGQPGTEVNIYLGSRHEVSASVADKLGISKIIDIGARTVAPPAHLGAASVTCLGTLKANSVAHHLMSCRFGLLNYDVARLEKSGVFAAYAAHGVIPICIESQAKPPDGLAEGLHFLRWPLRTLPDFCAMQRHLAQWYGGHSVRRHADLLASWCHSDQKMQ